MTPTMRKIVTSSSDPNKLSLTVKGVLVAIIPVAMVVTGLAEAQLNSIIDAITDIVFLASSLVSAVSVLYGLVRKAYNGRWTAA